MDARDKEALRAAHVIKKYCEGSSCSNCLIGDGGCCDLPLDWELPEIEEEERRE